MTIRRLAESVRERKESANLDAAISAKPEEFAHGG